MLTESAYLSAIYLYVGAAILLLIYLAWILSRRLPPAVVALLILLGAALLLTPAYPKEGVDTMAPALIVAGFQLFTAGYDEAVHAFRPLLYACGLALVLAIAFLCVRLLRRRGT